MTQPVPPSWKDLGKLGSDLLNKDFPAGGTTALEVKTRAPNGVQFKTSGIKDSKNQIAGDIEGKYTDPKNGVVFTQTWTTANLLKSQLELEGQLAKGLKFDLQSTLSPASKAKSVLASAIYRQPGLHLRGHLDALKGPTFTSDAVLGRDGFFLGGEATYDVADGQIKRYNLASGFSTPDYAITLHALGNLSLYSASYYHSESLRNAHRRRRLQKLAEVNRDIEVVGKATYNAQSTTNNVALELGTKSYLDNASFVKAKVNNTGTLVLAYTQALRPGVKASFGVALDTVRLSNNSVDGGNAHSAGASFTFEG